MDEHAVWRVSAEPGHIDGQGLALWACGIELESFEAAMGKGNCRAKSGACRIVIRTEVWVQVGRLLPARLVSKYAVKNVSRFMSFEKPQYKNRCGEAKRELFHPGSRYTRGSP